MRETLQQWDAELLIYLNSLGNESWYSFWSFITVTISWIPLFLLIVFLIFKTFYKKQGFFVLLYFVFAVLVNSALMLTIKHSIGRARPVNVPEILESLTVFKEASGFSFYSGHASSSFLIATLATLLFRKKYLWIYFIYLFPVLFSYSRIYFGVHYVSDIAVGAIIGTLIAVFINKRINQALRHSVLIKPL